MSPNPTDNDSDEQFTRIRSNVQLGDGPDARGDVTVEIVREKTTAKRFADVTVPDGQGGTINVADVPMDDRAFAEWMIEMDRAVDRLRTKLGLDRE